MPLKFTEVENDETLNELYSILDFVEVEVAQYKIDASEPIMKYDFKDKKQYKKFFEQFAADANPLWRGRARGEWDFAKVPFREPSDTVKGVYRLLRTGGAYSETYERGKASEIEENLRKRFKKDSESLPVFCVVKTEFPEDDPSGGFTVDMKAYEVLGEISSFFNLIAWDDLIFIINPKYDTLYTIAYTDID
ncbi:MAG: hypothetical protein ACXABV_14055 [Candidatus Thorarchaeota archaeon]|jgi:hypothetical protein